MSLNLYIYENSHNDLQSQQPKTKLLVVIICAMLVFSVATSVVTEEKSKKADKKSAAKKEKSPKQKAKIKASKIEALTIKQRTQKEPKQPTQLELCKQKPTPREQFECEKEIKSRQELDAFKTTSSKYEVGPITFYYNGAKVEKSGSKDLVNLKFLVENSGSKENIILFCTGPSLCNYELSDGTTTYRYSANDFTELRVWEQRKHLYLCR